jgi:glycosyltransferase involved in cell wall biosynthesis
MQILIPDVCIPNTYIHDLAFALTELGHEIVWNSDNLFYSRLQPDVIISQWAEGYFRKRGELEKLKPYHLETLENNLSLWRQKTLIISFVHNVKPRPTGIQNLDINLERLFEINYNVAHGFVHLGQKSISDFENYYPPSVYKDKPSLVISHGLNELLRQKYPPEKNGVDKTNEFRIFVPGAIRFWSELALLIRAFIEARIPHKKLVIGGQGYKLEQSPVRLLARVVISNIPGILLFGRRLNDLEMRDELVAADIVVSPRIQATNSGIPYLAATYGKRCIAPNVGNLPEALEELKGILFEPNNPSSLAKAMEQVYRERETVLLPNPPCPSWQEIAREIENFITKLKQRDCRS